MGRWSKALWGVLTGMTFKAIWASILVSCGFKDGGQIIPGKYGKIRLSQSNLGLLDNLTY